MADWAPYVVAEGDTLTLLAYRVRTAPEDVWSHEKNAALSAQRKNGDILFPSDVVYLPTQPTPDATAVLAGSTNAFVSTVPMMKLRLLIEDYASSTYVANVGDPPLTGSVDSSGQLELEVPVTSSEVRIQLGSKQLELACQVGYLDPIDEVTGLGHRLSNLGLPATPDEDGHAVRRALALYQEAKSLDPTGELDPDTQTALENDHGM